MTFQPPPGDPTPGQQPPVPPAAPAPPVAPPVAEPGWSAPPPPAPVTQPGWSAPQPPAAQPGSPLQGFDPKTVNPLDWAILGVGFLTLIFSFFGFYTAEVKVSGAAGALAGVGSDTERFSAWHDIFGGGFFGWLGMIFAVAGAVFLALALFVPQVRLPIAARQAALFGFALGLLCELLALVVHPKFASYSGPGISASFGHGFSYYIILILVAGGLVLSGLRLKQTGGKLPWEPGGNPFAKS